jgi:hypothetical protein
MSTEQPGFLLFEAKEKGAVLILSLLLLAMMTMLTLMSIESSQFAYKVAVNRADYDEAFNNSESVRSIGAGVVKDYFQKGRWSETSLPDNLTLDQNAKDPSSDLSSSINRYDPNALTKLMSYRSNTISGDFYLLPGHTRLNDAGVGSSQFQSYSGVGAGVGSIGSMVKYMELRSVGMVAGKENRGLKVWTASDYRFVP